MRAERLRRRGRSAFFLFVLRVGSDEMTWLGFECWVMFRVSVGGIQVEVDAAVSGCVVKREKRSFLLAIHDDASKWLSTSPHDASMFLN